MNLSVWPLLLLVAAPGGNWHAVMCPGLRLCYNALSTLELPSYKEFCQKSLREGQLGSLWVAHVLFSKSTAFEFYTIHFLQRNFDL